MNGLNRSGEVEVEVVIPFELPEVAFAAARHIDGKLYVAVVRNKNGRLVMSVTRLESNNTPDPAYGSNGFADVEFEDPRLYNVYGLAMLFQDDGGLIIIGRDMFVTVTVAAFARFDSNGQLDESFGDAGKVVHDFGPTPLASRAHVSSNPEQDGPDWRSLANGRTGGMFLQAGERFLYFDHLADENNNGFLARFKLNGRLDTEFGNEGLARMSPPGPSPARVILYGITELTDGKIIAYGHVVYSALPYKGFIARFLSTGEPDETFGDLGYLIVEGPEEFSSASIILMSFRGVAKGADSSLVCSGALRIQSPTGEPSEYGVVACFDKNGAPLPSFNTGKPVVFGLLNRNNEFSGVALQADNKIVAGGYSEVVGVTPVQVNYLVARFNVDGTRDVTFAGQGHVSGAFEPGVHLVDLLLMDRGLITAFVKYQGTVNQAGKQSLYCLGLRV